MIYGKVRFHIHVTSATEVDILETECFDNMPLYKSTRQPLLEILNESMPEYRLAETLVDFGELEDREDRVLEVVADVDVEHIPPSSHEDGWDQAISFENIRIAFLSKEDGLQVIEENSDPGPIDIDTVLPFRDDRGYF